MTTAKAKTQRVSGATGGGQVAKMYRSIRRAKLEPMEKLVTYDEANRDEAFTTAMRACKTEDERDALRDARFDPLVEAFKANWARRHAPHITPRVVSPPSRPA